MGLPCFSKIIRYASLALVGSVVAIAAIIALSSPAAAEDGDGGNRSEKSWDTDNLRYGSYSAKSFNIPFHDYSGYSGVDACQSYVADGFFQAGYADSANVTDTNVPEDFPTIQYSTSGATIEPPASETVNNTGCDLFVAQQERLKTQVAANTG